MVSLNLNAKSLLIYVSHRVGAIPCSVLITEAKSPLEPGVTGTLSSYYYFQSQANNGMLFSSHVDGELYSYFYRRDTLDITEYNCSPCGKNRALNIEAETSVESSDPNASGAFYMDSVDGEFSHVYGIQWQRC